VLLLEQLDAVASTHVVSRLRTQIARLVENSERDPNSIANIRRGMSRVSKDIILMEEVRAVLACDL